MYWQPSFCFPGSSGLSVQRFDRNVGEVPQRIAGHRDAIELAAAGDIRMRAIEDGIDVAREPRGEARAQLTEHVGGGGVGDQIRALIGIALDSIELMRTV